jgi:hypothetical protein
MVVPQLAAAAVLRALAGSRSDLARAADGHPLAEALFVGILLAVAAKYLLFGAPWWRLG